MIKTETAHPAAHFSNVLLTGTILLANADVNGLIAYGVKAAVGGAIWLAYKLAADYIDRRRKPKN
jgi:hypothetical protein